jgi:hypothetical protein
LDKECDLTFWFAQSARIQDVINLQWKN